jgi:hypothetical protein
MQSNTALLFLGLSLFTLIGFILKSITRYDPESYTSPNPILRMISQSTFIVLTSIMWIILIYLSIKK